MSSDLIIQYFLEDNPLLYSELKKLDYKNLDYSQNINLFFLVHYIDLIQLFRVDYFNDLLDILEDKSKLLHETLSMQSIAMMHDKKILAHVPKFPIEHIYYHIISNINKISKYNSDMSYKPELDRIVNEVICKNKSYNVGGSSSEDKPYAVGKSSLDDKPYVVGGSSSEDKPYAVGKSSLEDTVMKKLYNDLYNEFSLLGIMPILSTETDLKLFPVLVRETIVRYVNVVSAETASTSVPVVSAETASTSVPVVSAETASTSVPVVSAETASTSVPVVSAETASRFSVRKNIILMRNSIMNGYPEKALILLNKLKCYPFNPKYIEFYKNTIDLLQNKYVDCDLLIALLEQLLNFLNPLPSIHVKISFYLILISSLFRMRTSPRYKEYYSKIIGYYEKNFNDDTLKIDNPSIGNKRVSESSNEPPKVGRSLHAEDETHKVARLSIDGESSKENDLNNKYNEYVSKTSLIFYKIKEIYYRIKYYEESDLTSKKKWLLKNYDVVESILSFSFNIFVVERLVVIYDEWEQYQKIIDLFLRYKSKIIEETKKSIMVPRLYARLLNAMVITHNIQLMIDIINVMKEMEARTIPVNCSHEDKDMLVKTMAENYKTINTILTNVKKSRNLIVGLGMNIIGVNNLNSNPKVFKDDDNKAMCLFCHENLVPGIAVIECTKCEKYTGHMTCVYRHLLYLTSVNKKPMCVSCRHQY
jgi:hypothetical protein